MAFWPLFSATEALLTDYLGGETDFLAIFATDLANLADTAFFSDRSGFWTTGALDLAFGVVG